MSDSSAEIPAPVDTGIDSPVRPVSARMAARVLVEGLSESLSYEIDPRIIDVKPGFIVQVPLGNRAAKGWVIETLPLDAALAEFETQPVTSLQTTLGFSTTRRLKIIEKGFPAFDPTQLPVFRWIAEYYASPLIDVIETAVPIPNPLLKRKLTPSTRKLKTKASKPELVPWKFRQVVRDNLSPTQRSAVEALDAKIAEKVFSPYLLFGVTGSGKTEVYLHAIEEALRQGGNALVIVPEIALTPQLFDQFRERIGDSLGLLHSQIGSTERWETWDKLLRGELRVALGARSAIFAPLSNLRLIIVDEEHESSYKQGDGLRYHARDVAIIRAKESNCPVLLGSATPSFESLFNVTRKRFSILEMPDRVTARPLPEIELVDLRKINKKEMPTPTISPRLFELLAQTLAQKGQAIIMYNRRGFATTLQCSHCGDVLSCPNCSVSLTFHRGRERAICHYCEFSIASPKFCPKCRDDRLTRVDEDAENEMHGALIQLGAGTERVVTDLQTLFPTAVIAQMDRDTVTKKDAHREILDQMRSGRADILVGTQMIAKGHDLPGVTLVGIVDADVGLHMPDFRASEKSYQLLTQASGRAGRGTEPGRVVIQTREPDHPAIVATVSGRFKAFARFEMEQRKELRYPPFSRLLRIVISAPNFSLARGIASAVPQLLQRSLMRRAESNAPTSVPQILGPAPAPQERLRGRYRFHVIVKSSSAKLLSELAGELFAWKSALNEPGDFRLTADIDPVDML